VGADAGDAAIPHLDHPTDHVPVALDEGGGLQLVALGAELGEE
jgi:hypothetical protein